MRSSKKQLSITTPRAPISICPAPTTYALRCPLSATNLLSRSTKQPHVLHRYLTVSHPTPLFLIKSGRDSPYHMCFITKDLSSNYRSSLKVLSLSHHPTIYRTHQTVIRHIAHTSLFISRSLDGYLCEPSPLSLCDPTDCPPIHNVLYTARLRSRRFKIQQTRRPRYWSRRTPCKISHSHNQANGPPSSNDRSSQFLSQF